MSSPSDETPPRADERPALSPERGETPSPSAPGEDATTALLRRWFVTYNPIYLVSAALVLVGLNLLSRGLAGGGGTGPLAVALVADLYAAALLGGAAFLYRDGKRRPAVLLALLAALYQGDLALHTELCAVLGRQGALPSLLWLTAFVAKLFAFGAALRLRLARRAIATVLIGALALAGVPYLLPRLDADAAGSLVGALVLVIGALAPRRPEEIATSKDTLDAWGKTVLRRSLGATFAIWGGLAALHVLFWAHERPIALFRVVPPVLALVLARGKHEGRLWVASLGGLAVATLVAPTWLSYGAFVVAAGLLVRAFSPLASTAVAERTERTAPSPYRAARNEPLRETERTVVYARVAPPERLRLLSGALVMGHLGAWSTGWQGGAFPSHVLLLDAALVAFAVALVLTAGGRAILAYVATIGAHALVEARLVPVPSSATGWGVVTLGAGFVLLLLAIFVSHKVDTAARPRHEPE